MERLSAEESQRFDEIVSAFRNHDFSRLDEFFNLFDRNRSGTIDASEIQDIMEHVIDEPIPDNEAEIIIQGLDHNHNGVIDLNEFMKYIERQFS
ncbi:hypothetical protein SteCoe_21078 [Stentor coeruleus]|uniref:EF-hand domain-containing protein n=1 Tax=Stentor coeruleus TaxID=5963 RepID=A0A1R2BQK2_9CILI|nr:hypothetical protein SteCoe_21078 [Stentor coeruleus]